MRLPEIGDLYHAELGPVRGTEQDGDRPVLIVSSYQMHRLSRRAFVCPITSNIAPWPTKMLLPGSAPVQGAVLIDQMRAIDREARLRRHIGQVERSFMSDVHLMLVAMLQGLDPEVVARGESFMDIWRSLPRRDSDAP